MLQNYQIQPSQVVNWREEHVIVIVWTIVHIKRLYNAISCIHYIGDPDENKIWPRPTNKRLSLCKQLLSNYRTFGHLTPSSGLLKLKHCSKHRPLNKKTKFTHVVCVLPAQYASEVRDIILCPPEQPYEANSCSNSYISKTSATKNCHSCYVICWSSEGAQQAKQIKIK